MLHDLQKTLTQILTSPNPADALLTALENPSLSPADRAHLQSINPAGLHLASLLTQKLRFQRLLAGDPTLQSQFDTNPAAFTTLFRAYTQEIPSTTPFPNEEARQFHTWLKTQTPPNPV